MKQTINNSMSPFEQFMKGRYFGSLNGIRALCALAVIKIHCHWDWAWVPKLFNQGDLGVDVFFTISGFLIVTLLLRERDKTGKINLKGFYVRRSLRIFPIYYLLIALVFFFYLVISPWAPNGLNYYSQSLPYLLIYSQNIIFLSSIGIFSHCWSLAMEEQFYLIWPAVEKWLSFKWRSLMLLLVLGISQMGNFGFFRDEIVQAYGFEDAYKLPMYLITFTPITLGVVLAYCLNSRISFNIFYKILGSRWSVTWVLLSIIILREYTFGQGFPRLALHLLIMCLLASVVIREDHVLSGILKNKFLFYLGAISYGIYLYHIAIKAMIESLAQKLNLLITPSILFVLTTFITIFVAHISFKYFETPLINLKHKINV